MRSHAQHFYTRMTTNIWPWLIGCLVFSVAMVMGIGPAEAVASLQYTYGNTTVSCPDSGVFTARVVVCVQAGLEHATDHYLQLFSGYMKPTVWAAITLSAVFFGVNVATGRIEHHRIAPQSMIYLLKVGIVATYAFNMGGLVPVIYEMMTDIENIVTSSLMHASNYCTTHTLPGNASVVWDRIDCALGKVIGFGSSVTLSGGLLALLAGGLFSGIFAVAMFFVGISALYVMLCAVIRPVWVFLLAYTAVGFFMILSPLFVPMLLFRATNGYFEKWLDQLTIAMLQPIMVFAFMSMFMTLIDICIYDFNNAIGNNLEKSLRVPTPTYEPYVATGSTGFDVTAGGKIAGKTKPPLPADTSPTLRDSPDYTPPRVYHFDFGTPGQHNSRVQSITVSLVSISIVFYLMLTTSQYIPQLASQMVGMKSAWDVTAGHRQIVGEKRARAAMDKARKEMEKKMKWQKGFGAVVKGVSAAYSGGITGFIDSTETGHKAIKFIKRWHGGVGGYKEN